MNPESPHRDPPFCTSAQLLSYPSPLPTPFFSGQGTLLQPPKSKLGFCKLPRESSFLHVFGISLWSRLLLYKCHRAWQNCSIFRSTGIWARSWLQSLFQAAIQFSLLLEIRPLTDPNKTPKLAWKPTTPGEAMRLQRWTNGNEENNVVWLVRKERSLHVVWHFCNS